MIKYDMNRHVEMITLISCKCRDKFMTVTRRGASIDSLYRCTIVVAPIEMPSNITYSYIIYRLKTFFYILKSISVASSE